MRTRSCEPKSRPAAAKHTGTEPEQHKHSQAHTTTTPQRRRPQTNKKEKTLTRTQGSVQSAARVPTRRHGASSRGRISKANGTCGQKELCLPRSGARSGRAADEAQKNPKKRAKRKTQGRHCYAQELRIFLVVRINFCALVRLSIQL